MKIVDGKIETLEEFNGVILLLLKDQSNCIHLIQKKSKAPANVTKFISYIEKVNQEYGELLVKSYIINMDDDEYRYVWSSAVWRKGLSKDISPNHQKYLTFLEKNRSDIRFIGPYKAMRTKALHLCKYGHEWFTQPIKVKTGEKCPICNRKTRESHGAKYITKILAQNNVEFVKEVSLKEFDFTQDLRLDFVICKNNYPLFAIEFNGIQHYKPLRSKFFGGYKSLGKRKQNDRLKRQLCWSIGLPIIDIPYSETEDQIKETINYFLELFKISKLQ